MPHDRSQWLRCDNGPVTIGKKTYKNLVEFQRPCQTCNQPFSIFVTQKIAEGKADSNAFGLKNCEAHRRGGGATIDNLELEQLRMANKVMSEELTGVYARLAKYELGSAMQVVKNTVDGGLPKSLPWE